MVSKKGKVVPMFNSLSTTPRSLIGEWRYSSTLLDVAHYMEVSGQLYPWRKSPRYPLDRRLGGPQRRSGHYKEEKSLAPVGNQTLLALPIAHRYAYWAIPVNTVDLWGIVMYEIGEKYIIKSFIICSLRHMLWEYWNQNMRWVEHVQGWEWRNFIT
jgi:hypothetical protein